MLSVIRDRFPGRNRGQCCFYEDCISGFTSQAVLQWRGNPRASRDAQTLQPGAFYLHLSCRPCKLRTTKGKSQAILMYPVLGCAQEQLSQLVSNHGYMLDGIQGSPRAPQCKQEISSSSSQVALC